MTTCNVRTCRAPPQPMPRPAPFALFATRDTCPQLIFIQIDAPII